MEHDDAVALIRGGTDAPNDPQHWADLGCGRGTFTRALAELLPAGSIVEAVDHDAAALRSLPTRLDEVIIRPHAMDMQATLPWTALHGVLMANALHYVADQPAFLRRLAKHLHPTGRLLFVEYERQAPNPWVPYPVGLAALRALFPGRTVTKLAERPSAFGGAVLYAAVVR